MYQDHCAISQGLKHPRKEIYNPKILGDGCPRTGKESHRQWDPLEEALSSRKATCGEYYFQIAFFFVEISIQELF
jgi:hypothetical protein